MKDNLLLSVTNLKTVFQTESGLAPAADNISFDLHEAGTMGLVGESGCGKSVTALSILRLVPSPPGRIVAGSVLFKGENLMDATEKRMRKIRGNQISMIFQDPMTSLNPVYRCGDQIAESITVHKKVTRKEARSRAIDLLGQVGIPKPEQRANDYPHQLSGGMRQRVMIASAIACDIALLIADEPTTALDVTVQAQILELLKKLQQEKRMSLLLITHDLGIVAENTEQIAVMYAGRIQEQTRTAELFARPLHPYTQGLMASIPDIGENKGKLQTISGTVPSPENFPRGCRFHPRCPQCMERCKIEEPELLKVGEDHYVRCFIYDNL